VSYYVYGGKGNHLYFLLGDEIMKLKLHNHKDKNKLLKFYHQSAQPFLSWEKDDLWSFDGFAIDEWGHEWWLLFNTYRADCSMRVPKRKHQGWKQALAENGYEVEVLNK